MKLSSLSNLEQTKGRKESIVRVAARESTTLHAFICAFLLFCLGQSYIVLGVTKTSLPRQSATAHHFKFTWINSGRALKKGALEVSFSRYKSEDGVEVERLVEKYGSTQEALAELERLSRLAVGVTKRGTKVDANGHEIGKRVELILRRSKDIPEETVIAWADDRRVFKLVSQSTKHVLDFEELDYPASLPKISPTVQ